MPVLWMLQHTHISHLQGTSWKVTTHVFIITSSEFGRRRMRAELEDEDSVFFAMTSLGIGLCSYHKHAQTYLETPSCYKKKTTFCLFCI